MASPRPWQRGGWYWGQIEQCLIAALGLGQPRRIGRISGGILLSTWAVTASTIAPRASVSPVYAYTRCGYYLVSEWHPRGRSNGRDLPGGIRQKVDSV
eukprot:scaffold104454_cov75-Phaeocystis_antarctica.AAC.2